MQHADGDEYRIRVPKSLELANLCESSIYDHCNSYNNNHLSICHFKPLRTLKKFSAPAAG